MKVCWEDANSVDEFVEEGPRGRGDIFESSPSVSSYFTSPCALIIRLCRLWPKFIFIELRNEAKINRGPASKNPSSRP